MTTRSTLARRAVIAALGIGATVGSLLPVATASAATLPSLCIPSQTAGSTSWNYRMCGIADIDQPRVGLPGNGSQYCVPTSTLNAMFWLDKHGYPNLLVGDYDPQSSADPDYSAVTSKIAKLGELMDTDGEDGTPSGADSGMNDQFEEKGYEDALEASEVDLTDEALPGRTLAQLGSRGHGENLLVLRLRHYDEDGDDIGGHAVTLTRSVGTSSGSSTITFNDPSAAPNGGSGDLTTQSPFAEQTFTLGSRNDDGYKVIGYRDGNYRLSGAYFIERLVDLS
ncbi:hypothetical protein [Streptomyces sp. NPDC057675]|uniref:hypothetical protein n=1 Tax=Streptomyces sp. NPDC057675 TaxID=3346204 RepID=UPI003692691D